MRASIALAILLASSASAVVLAEAPATQPGVDAMALPGGIGVNIHFTDPRPGEMEMLADGGFTWVRMDFSWAATEHKPGEYDFSPYDRLMAALEKHQIRPILIFDYSNGLYDQNLSPHSDAGRAAFAAWAAAAAHHFRGRGVYWEMYNEPNITFWKPRTNVEDYAKLALAVGKALRDAEPGETYIGPGTSGIDFHFMEACFKAGLLEYWSAVSCHPYRQTEPETAAEQYRQLRLMIARYAPAGRHVPIISSEWGYSSAWHDLTEERQGQYLAREFLTNQWQEVPVSIWYDWHEDGTDPKESEHHFGSVRHAYHKDATPVYEPKPAYLAARALTNALAGFAFSKRLMMEKPEDFMLLFDKGENHGEQRLAAWTTAKEPHAVRIATSPGAFAVTSHLGEKLADLTADENGLTVMLSGSPLYLAPANPDARLRVAAEWQRLPLEIIGNGPAAVQVAKETPPIMLDRSATPHMVRLACPKAGFDAFVQQTEVCALNPLAVTILPPSATALAVRLADAGGAGFSGTIVLTDVAGLELAASQEAVELARGQTEAIVHFPMHAGKSADFHLGVRVTDAAGQTVLTVAGLGVSPMADFASEPWKLLPDGASNVHSEQSLSVEGPLEAAPEPGMGVLKITYKTGAGWKFWDLRPTTAAQRRIEGQPASFGLWIYGDASGASPHARFTDTTGQTFQIAGETITWKGWRYVTMPMRGPALAHSHWGGKNDGEVHYPIHWDTVFLLDRDATRPAAGTIFIAGPTLVQ